MIDAKELRIGNWIIFKGYRKQIISIREWAAERGIYLIDLGDTREEMGIRTIDIHPIPLTTEILEKCGFKLCANYSDNDYTVYYDNDVDLFLTLNWRDRETGFNPQKPNYEGELESFGIEIKYLHQLQNLYYALTQKELEVNL